MCPSYSQNMKKQVKIGKKMKEKERKYNSL